MGTMSSAEPTTRVRLELEEGYRFVVDMGSSFEHLVMDEPEPLGEASGPNASTVLAAAIGNCLSASLLYCLRRARVEVTGFEAAVEVRPARNAEGRLRIGSVDVALHPTLGAGVADEGRFQRCLELFERFCVVTQSIRDGVQVDVAVEPSKRDQTVATKTDGDS